MARRLTLTPVVDANPALRAFGQIQTGAGKFSGALAGVGAKARTAWSGVAGAMYASGLPGQFGQVSSLLQNVSMGFNNMGETGRKSWGKAMMGVGVITAGLGGAAEMLSSPLEAAQAQLKQSVKNAGGNFSALTKPIDAQQKKMETLGYTYQDTDQALALLTQGLGSPKKALAELGLDADLAARSGGTLVSSATAVVKSYAKSPMVLKQFGINLTDITKLGTQATAAQKAHTKALTAQQKAQLELSQLQARLGVSSQTKGVTATNELATAQTELATAGQHLQTVQVKIETGTGNQATAQQELLAAQQRVATATAKLDQAQAKANDTGSLTIAEQQQLANASAKVAAANSLVTTTGQTAVATAKDLGKNNITGGQILDMISKKTHGLAEAQAKTFGGDLRKWKAQVIDFGATWGEKFAKPLIAIGPALAGVGTLVETGFFGKIGSGIKGLVTGIGGLASKLVGLGSTGAGLKGAVGTVDGSGAAASIKSAITEGGSTAAGDLKAAEVAGGETAAADLKAAEVAGGETAAADLKAAEVAGGETAAADLKAAEATGGAAAGGEAAAGSGLGTGAAGVGRWAATAPVAPAAALAGIGAVGYGALKLAGASGAGGVTTAGGDRSIADYLLGKTWTVSGKNFITPQQLSAASAANVAAIKAQPKGTVPGQTGKTYRVPAMTALPHYAAGGIVPSTPGGRLIVAGEAGDEEVRPRTAGSSGSGPQVVHYHENQTVNIGTLQTSDLSTLQRQLKQEQQRANFSGAGLPGGSD